MHKEHYDSNESFEGYQVLFFLGMPSNDNGSGRLRI